MSRDLTKTIRTVGATTDLACIKCAPGTYQPAPGQDGLIGRFEAFAVVIKRYNGGTATACCEQYLNDIFVD